MTEKTPDGAHETLPEAGAGRVGWAYAVADDAAQAQARFDAWAAAYDADVETLLGYRLPAEASPVIQRHIPTDARLLDAGAGTGLVGALLAPHGYDDMLAADISENMLKAAAETGAYRATAQINLRARLPFEDAAFDAVVAVGVSGYMDPGGVAEFIRVVRPAGVIVFTCGVDTYAERYAAAIDASIAARRLETLETTAPFQAIPRSEPDHLARVHVWRRL